MDSLILIQVFLPNNKTAPNIGGEDYWAIKVNSAGTITWDQSYGGADLDRSYSVEVVDLTDCVTTVSYTHLTLPTICSV